MFKIEGTTKWRDASVSLDTCVLFSSPKNPEGGIFSYGDVEHLVISLKLYELDTLTSCISVVVIPEIVVVINSNRSVGSGGLLMHVSLTLVAVVIFTKHILTLVFISVILF